MQEIYKPLGSLDKAIAFHRAKLITNGVDIGDADRTIASIGANRRGEFLSLTGRLARSTDGQIHPEELKGMQSKLDALIGAPETPQPTKDAVRKIIAVLTKPAINNGNSQK